MAITARPLWEHFHAVDGIHLYTTNNNWINLFVLHLKLWFRLLKLKLSHSIHPDNKNCAVYSNAFSCSKIHRLKFYIEPSATFIVLSVPWFRSASWNLWVRRAWSVIGWRWAFNLMHAHNRGCSWLALEVFIILNKALIICGSYMILSLNRTLSQNDPHDRWKTTLLSAPITTRRSCVHKEPTLITLI